MASAGRILIMPKGDYDSSVAYEMLDLVTHNGTAWLAKKESVGIEPSVNNAEYWMLLFDVSNIEARLSNIEAKVREYTENNS